MSSPKVSILVPCYNGAAHLRFSIDSALSQTFRDFELVAINDGSTDETPNILDAYRDSRVRVIHLERNVGLAAVNNIGIEEAKGEYIAWLDSDDISLPHRLEKQVRVLAADHRLGICGTWVKTIGDEPSRVWRYPRHDSLIRAQFVFSDPLATSSVMVRRAVLQSERFDLEYPPAADYELWQRLSARCRVVNIPEVLTEYRIHSSQTTATTESRLRQKKAVMRVHQQQLKRLAGNDKAPITPEQLELHYRIGTWQFERSVAFVDQAEQWLLRLIGLNAATLSVPEPTFSVFVSQRMWAVCRHAQTPGRALARFLSSPLARVVLRHPMVAFSRVAEMGLNQLR